MKWVRRTVNVLVLLAATNLAWSSMIIEAESGLRWDILGIIWLLAFLFVNIRPIPKNGPTKRIWYLRSGAELLRLFLITATVNVLSVCAYFLCFRSVLFDYVYAGMFFRGIWALTIFNLMGLVVLEAVLFWNGMIRVYLTSVQLGVKHRVLAALCGWIPFLNIWYLTKIIRITSEEAEFETEKWELDARIRQIVEETGCEKVNIIAHSKGGLDSRAAIAHCGMAPYVATLTTINTPHRGCIFAEYLLGKVPEAAQQKIASTYNAALKRLGDEDPDFLAAVTDLTESACLARNETTPDVPGVVYESVMSYCRKARHGKFPLNMTYPIVKHFDGLNDGLVSVESAKWGGKFTLLEPSGKQGISHGDVVDLNRENVKGFDVREFYVNLVADLKQRGY